MKKEDNKVDSFFGRDKNTIDKKKTIENKFKEKKEIKDSLKSTVATKRANSFKKKKDDLSALKGIGPAIVKVLNKKGILTFDDLVSQQINDLKKIVSSVKGGHKPELWIKEASKYIINKNEGVPLVSVKTEEGKSNLKEANHNAELKRKRKTISNKHSAVEKLFAKKTVSGKKGSSKKSIKTKTKLLPKKNKQDIKKKSFLLAAGNSLLVVLFFMLGLFFTRQTFQGIDFEKSIFFYLIVTGVAILTIITFLIKRQIRIRKTPFDFMLVVFVLIYGISAWFSIDRWHSLWGFFGDPSRGLVFILAMVLVFYLIVGNFTIKTARKAFWAIVISMVILSIYTLFSGLKLIPTNLQIFVPFTLVGSLKGLAIMLLGGMPLLSMAYLSLGSWRNKKVAFLLKGMLSLSLIVIIVDFLILKAFVPWTILAITAGSLIFLLTSESGKSVGKKFSRIIIFTMLAVIIMIAGWAKSDYYGLMPTIIKIGLPTEVHTGLPVSYEIVKNSLISGWQQMIAGSGPATFGYDFAKFTPRGIISPVPTVQYLYQGEGVLAESIPTIGVAGTLLLVIMGIIFIVMMRKSVFGNSFSKSKMGMYKLGLIIATLGFMMSSLTNQINGGVVISMVLFVSLTVFFILEDADSKKYYTINLQGVSFANFFGAFAVIIVLLSLLGSGFYIAKAYVADVYFAKAVFSKDAKKSDKIIEAIKIQPKEGVYYSKLGQVLLLEVGKKAEEGERLNEQEINNFKKGIVGYAEAGARLIPNDVKTQKFLARVYEQTGVTNSLESVYRRVVDLDPNAITYYVKLGDNYLLQGKENKEKIDKALEWYQKALIIQPNSAIIYDRIATAFYQKGEIDKSIVSMAKAVTVEPNNLSYKFTLGVLYQLKDNKKDKAIAEKIFKTLLKSSPNNIDILTQLGLLYEQTNHIDQAKEQYQQIIKIVGDNDKLKKIKEVFNKFIDNLNEGKLNIKQQNVIAKGLNKAGSIDNDSQENNGEENKVENKVENNSDEIDNEQVSDVENNDIQNKQINKITITVGPEGPINVRANGSLTGKKLTKIKKTTDFEKIGENEKWVQILIPTQGDQSDIKGWVHKKFVTE